MSKNNELDYYKKLVLKLKKENLLLKEELSKRKDSKEKILEKNPCGKCHIGEIEEIHMGVKTMHICNSCGWRRIKSIK